MSMAEIHMNATTSISHEYYGVCTYCNFDSRASTDLN
jgi:hypothetical protein